MLPSLFRRGEVHRPGCPGRPPVGSKPCPGRNGNQSAFRRSDPGRFVDLVVAAVVRCAWRTCGPPAVHDPTSAAAGTYPARWRHPAQWRHPARSTHPAGASTHPAGSADNRPAIARIVPAEPGPAGPDSSGPDSSGPDSAGLDSTEPDSAGPGSGPVDPTAGCAASSLRRPDGHAPAGAGWTRQAACCGQRRSTSPFQGHTERRGAV